MDLFQLTSALALAVGALGLLAAGVWAARRRRPGLAPAPGPAAAPEAMLHRVELRMEAIEGLQAAFAARLEAQGPDDAAERRLQAMAGQILGLVRDKDASLEMALAGLDQIRARMRVLEQIGEPAEARALFERLGVRLDALAEAQAATETRLAGLAAAEPPVAALAERLARLHAQKDATVETVFARLAPLEAKLAAVAARDPQGALDRFAERLDAARAAQEAATAALGDRVAGLETAENPYAAISERLAGLYAQKDATVETVFARLAPLEAKLAAVEGTLASRDPQGALDRFAERLDAARAAQEAATAALGDRVAGLETAENPYAAISERLAGLYAQKDATVETVFARLAPLEAKLAAVAARDPQGALDRFAERLDAARAAQEAATAALGDRVAGLETAENPYAAISERLAGLYAQKDATVETVFARLAPLEAKLAAVEGTLASRDPQGALDRFAERLDAARAAQEAATAALGDRVAGLETAENPYAAISERLAGLYAQKDATVETVFARLAPLEAKLAAVEGTLASRDPQGALDRFAERLEALQGRLAGLEGAENPDAAISERLAGLYAQKDATVETVFARLAPLEAKLAAVEGALASRDPQGALERFAERLDAARAAQEAATAALGDRVAGLEGAENPYAAISERLAGLYAQKDAGVEAAFARLGPLEARLEALERTGADEGAEAARNEAQAIAAQLVAARTVAEETRLFASRITLLEASLPRLSHAQALMMQALERQAAPAAEAWPRAEAPAAAAPPPEPEAEPEAAPEAAAGDAEALWRLPRVVSVHKA